MHPVPTKLQAYPFKQLRSVVVSGNLPAADGKYGLYYTVTVKRWGDGSRNKTSINKLLEGE